MKLKTLYSLRNNFTIIGITGKHGGGSSRVATYLSDEDFIKETENQIVVSSNKAEDIKVKIAHTYLNYQDNFKSYEVIDYKSVLLLHLFHESILLSKCENNEEWRRQSILKIINIICQNGKSGPFKEIFENRFDTFDNFQDLEKLLQEKLKAWFDALSRVETKLNDYLKEQKSNEILYRFYFQFFKKFSHRVYELLFKICPVKRSRLLHDLGNNLRLYGTVINKNDNNNDVLHIYTVAQSINYLIKSYKSHNNETKIVIDSLKNSLELMYFKEKFSAFYMVSVNSEENDRRKYIARNFNNDQECFEFKQTFNLGEWEYSGSDFSKGKFAYPDIENCIQKSEYHISFESEFHVKIQLIKLLSLIEHPGIITPTSIERCMQIAFNAKLNSGCISRQVGAVITDNDYVIKSIGWNDVAKYQLPCKLRNANDLILNRNSKHFSKYERNGIVETGNQKVKFVELLDKDISKIEPDDMQGLNCSFCFKSHLNTYEGEKNQVHTRSLHAEENAMMQIAKNGGEGLKNGILFTTASPCELCSKKAYQLGINKIYYIDPYPGIATDHILSSGIQKKKNPELILFNGAIGKTFHKLYDAFLPYKDELAIRTGMKPTPPKATEVSSVKTILERNLSGVDKKDFDNFMKDKSQDMDGVLELIKLGLESQKDK
jgi:deoxycytidylate deaminase